MRTVEAVLLIGAAVAGRSADASRLRLCVEELCGAGVHVLVVSEAPMAGMDGWRLAHPPHPGTLHLCAGRGAEVYEMSGSGPCLIAHRRVADVERQALDAAAASTLRSLAERGVVASLAPQQPTRRQIELPTHPMDRPTIVDIARASAAEAGLVDARVTADPGCLEIGLTDESDSARWAAGWLADIGITGSLVLVVGDQFGEVDGVAGRDARLLIPELARATFVSVGPAASGVPERVEQIGGGAEGCLDLLTVQLGRRRDRRVPWIDEDPAWVVALPPEPHLERNAESIGMLSNGRAGVRASREEERPGSSPGFLVSGLYTTGPATGLVEGPHWARLEIDGAEPDRRVLDLRTGMLARSSTGGSGLRSVRFVSATRPDAMAMRAEGAPGMVALAPISDAPTERRADGADAAAGSDRPDDAEQARIVVASSDVDAVVGGRRVIERLATWAVQTDQADAAATAATTATQLEHVAEHGFDRLVAEHRAEWARRWSDALVVIDGDPEVELAARFAMFHLLSAASDGGECAVGARGLSGRAYGGHVFWDADVFVLPVLAAVRPAAARAMLEYRIRRLPAARAAAAARRRQGARFPWECAADGTDVTPRFGVTQAGSRVAIFTGDAEEHITADVAWAACTYAAWSGDEAFLAGAGRGLVVETARYWASRIRVDSESALGHIDGVIGPDEYHELVDDNAFTNVMARWNLRQGAALLERTDAGSVEARRWRWLADRLADGWHADRGLYEQFAGYFALEPLIASSVATPPFAADLVLGARRVRGSQIIKQADVLMLYHLLPDDVHPEALATNLHFYDRRTAHGSSLSPAIHASLLARAGRPDRALELLRVAARLDLDDLTGTTASGLHLATMGGLWQALAHGFLGLRIRGTTLLVDPCLPNGWNALELRLRVRGEPVAVRAEHDQVRISCRAPLDVMIAGASCVRCVPPGETFDIRKRRS